MMEEFKKFIGTDKLIIGTKRTMKALRHADVAKIFLANNCPEMLVEDIEHYASFSDIPVEKLAVACDELGSVCKKPFMVSVVTLLK